MRNVTLALLLVCAAAADGWAQPPQAKAAYDRGRKALEAKDHGKAAAELREAVKSDPNFVDALKDLAWLEATSDDTAVRSPKEAVRHAETAIDNIIKMWVNRATQPPEVKEKINALYVARAGNALAAAYAADGRFEPNPPQQKLDRVQKTAGAGAPPEQSVEWASVLEPAAVPYAEWALSLARNEDRKRKSAESTRLVKETEERVKIFKSKKPLRGRIPPP